jgi:uncharacterized protein (TIGR04222 family)
MSDQAKPSGRMAPEQRALYQRIVNHTLDAPDVPLPFSRSLAERERWSHAHALQVIVEYRRFVFLALSAGHVATPSKAVDAAWHLHLEYTRDYWDVFCANVLHAPLHHDPGTGAANEGAAFASLYKQTLNSYREAFGEEPPVAIWPRPNASDICRDETPHGPSVDKLRTSRNSSKASANPPGEPKPAWLTRLRTSTRGTFPARGLLLKLLPGSLPGLPPGLLPGLIPLLAATLLTSCGNPHDIDVFDYPGPDFLRFYFTLGAGVLIVIGLTHRVLYRIQRWGSARSEFGVRDLLPHEAAFLKGGTSRMVHVAVIEMMQAGLIILIDKKKGAPAVEIGPEFDGGVFMSECDWLRHVKNGRTSYLQFSRRLALREKDMLAKARSMGWWWNRNDMLALKWTALSLCLLVICVGIAKAGVGIVRDRPIGYLVASMVLFVIAYKIVKRRLPGFGRQGPTFAARTMLKVQENQWKGPADANPNTLLWKAALIGPAVLFGTPWAAHAAYFSMTPLVPTSSGGTGSSSDSGGSSCSSSSCSSSSCSSGCGGCGSS